MKPLTSPHLDHLNDSERWQSHEEESVLPTSLTKTADPSGEVKETSDHVPRLNYLASSPFDIGCQTNSNVSREHSLWSPRPTALLPQGEEATSISSALNPPITMTIPDSHTPPQRNGFVDELNLSSEQAQAAHCLSHYDDNDVLALLRATRSKSQVSDSNKLKRTTPQAVIGTFTDGGSANVLDIPIMGPSKHKRKLEAHQNSKPEELAKINKVRQMKACMRCRILDEMCSVNDPCEGCLKRFKPHKLERLLCIRTPLPELLTQLFPPARTGKILTPGRGAKAFKEELLPFGHRFIHSVTRHSDDELLNLANQCFDKQRSVIQLEKVSEVLQNLNTIYYRHISAASTFDPTPALLSVCVLMIDTRAFLEPYTRQNEIMPFMLSGSYIKPEVAIRSANSALEALFIVATLSMSDEECFSIILSCTAEDSDSESNDGK